MEPREQQDRQLLHAKIVDTINAEHLCDRAPKCWNSRSVGSIAENVDESCYAQPPGLTRSTGIFRVQGLPFQGLPFQLSKHLVAQSIQLSHYLFNDRKLWQSIVLHDIQIFHPASRCAECAPEVKEMHLPVNGGEHPKEGGNTCIPVTIAGRITAKLLCRGRLSIAGDTRTTRYYRCNAGQALGHIGCRDPVSLRPADCPRLQGCLRSQHGLRAKDELRR
mmetsp:Transcript_37656/g.82684  ORF Transcript_37656/g.82684 Transcript_37656/m.82684 type:complete len:220 (+) Transcript_37656:1176-1835(+)